MHPEKLERSEWLAAAGGLLLGVCVFMPWYSLDPETGNALLAGVREGSVSAWQAHSYLRWLLLAAAVAPLILFYIVLRDHELSWPRGEMTAVVAIAAFGIIGYLGVIDRPGTPPSEISIAWGWFGAMAGVILMVIGGAMRASGTERPRKPPGAL